MQKSYGIEFSVDKRMLVRYNRDLPDKQYIIPDGVTAVGKEAFAGCPCEASVRQQFPKYY